MYPFLYVFLILSFITAGLGEIQIKWKCHSTSAMYKYYTILKYFTHKKQPDNCSLHFALIVFYELRFVYRYVQTTATTKKRNSLLIYMIK